MQIIKINPNDNVAVATRKLKNGEKIKIEGHEIIVKDDVEMGNKIAINNIDKEEKIYKYGNVIGVAQEKIKEGKFIHTHNMKTELKIQEKYEYAPIFDMNEDSSNEEYFSGYYRKDGTVGIRNEIWIIPTVGCVNSIGRKLAEIGKNVISGSIDGVYCWEHPYGCSQMGEDQENTKRIIKCLCEHGNAGGVLLVGLGCENLNLEVLDVTERTGNDKIIRAFNCQDVYDEVAEGTKLLEEIALGIKECERKPIPISKLRVGIKCGGSDGFSGITANPLIGNVVDVLVDSGASILMSEVPEMFGAERILMNRCCDDRVFNKLVRMINDFKEYYTKHKMPIYDNPSPGNKKG
ncbi:MAG: UxaA family hydrolase, partial [Firmicutes bacterium]|nr:UxaA family hydrolase [Bacillota bacterium]